MKILNIAEKPSVAKSISKVLSDKVSIRRGLHKYCPNIYFKGENEMIFTSVLGHLYNQDFEKKYKWADIDPRILFFERIRKEVSKDFLPIKKNIEKEAVGVDLVIIWTDCDREGENIAMHISNIVEKIGNKNIKRARFSGIGRTEIQAALENLADINVFESNAVDARMELDLRIGSAFTVLQTICLQDVIETKQIVSFGPCQIPTLGFVVERSNLIENFIEEENYSLEFRVDKDGIENLFKWKRGHLFDKNCVIYFYNMLKDKKATIINKDVNEKKIFKPLPLRTVEFQKHCTSIFKISGHKLMEIAESLYNKGFISYPRTETDVFPRNFNFKSILKNLAKDSDLKAFADEVLINMKLPRCGKNNDMAHSPIYPLKSGNGLSGLDKSIHEYISRRFIAGLYDNAVAIETSYIAQIHGELFLLKGIKISEKNFLNVFIYEKHKEVVVSNFTVDSILLNTLKISTSRTTPPDYLTESELISLMDKHGIGTDATIHEHIQKIQDRKYASKKGSKIKPENLGIALINAYNLLQLDFSSPILRKNLEANLKKVSLNFLDHKDLIFHEIELYVQLFEKLSNNIGIFKEIISNFLNKSNEKENIEPPKSDSNKIANNINDNKPHRNKFNAQNHKVQQKTDKTLCYCNRYPIEKTVVKGENVGKIYLMCGNETKKCQFFKWSSADKANIDTGEIIKCYCDYEPQTLISKTDKNKGKRFYKCKKAYKPCKFFKWAD